MTQSRRNTDAERSTPSSMRRFTAEFLPPSSKMPEMRTASSKGLQATFGSASFMACRGFVPFPLAVTL